MTQEKIQITYREHVPIAILTDFKNKFKDGEVTIKEDRKQYFSADGDVVPDIAIIIGLTIIKLINQGTYDIIKLCIIQTWIKFKNYIQSKDKSKFGEGYNRRISLILPIGQGKSLEYNLRGNISDDVIIHLTENIFETVKDQNTITDYFNNSDLIDKWDKSKICFEYNPNKKIWLPVNYEKNKKYFEEMIKKANNEFLE